MAPDKLGFYSAHICIHISNVNRSCFFLKICLFLKDVTPVQPAAEAPLDTLGGEPEHLMVTLFPTFFLFNLALFPEFLFLKMSVLS